MITTVCRNVVRVLGVFLPPRPSSGCGTVVADVLEGLAVRVLRGGQFAHGQTTLGLWHAAHVRRLTYVHVARHAAVSLGRHSGVCAGCVAGAGARSLG